MKKIKIVGKAKDAGWEFGVRKTVPSNTREAWDFLFSENGAKLWLHDASKEFSTFKNLSHSETLSYGVISTWWLSSVLKLV